MLRKKRRDGKWEDGGGKREGMFVGPGDSVGGEREAPPRRARHNTTRWLPLPLTNSSPHALCLLAVFNRN
jgi:hypothetical protein